MKRVIIVGAGPAGLMAASAAAEKGASVLLLEKMDRVGRKLRITGNGRCNITAAVAPEQLIKGFPGNGRFLHSAFNRFSNQDLIAFINRLGVPTKIEEETRVLPASNRAEDVAEALHENALRSGVQIIASVKVDGLLIEDGKCLGVQTSEGAMEADAVIVATGGKSYPGTGSTGDAYGWARQAGHMVVEPRPSLVPLLAAEKWCKYLQGLSMEDVAASAYTPASKPVNKQRGALVFTHYGLSGPVILAMSKDIAAYLHKNGSPVLIKLDFMPECGAEQLDWQLQALMTRNARKQIKNALAEILPSRLIEIIMELAEMKNDTACHTTTRSERAMLLSLIKGLPLTIVGTRPLAEAIVTAGGIAVNEIDPRTMMSRKVAGLYFAGEVLDVDGYTGGYNLQAAFSTGYVAGQSAAT